MDSSIREKTKEFSKGIPECGTDALRYTLCSYDLREHFINFDVHQCQKSKLFFNKIWNAMRFTLHNCEQMKINHFDAPILDQEKLGDIDRWILSKLGSTTVIYKTAMDSFKFHEATSALKDFFYSNLCDVYLEAAKINLFNRNEPGASTHCEVLKTCMSVGLRQIGLFTPFLSNELLKYLPSHIEFAVSFTLTACLFTKQ